MTILTFSSCLDEVGGAASPQLREAGSAAAAERAAHAPGELAPVVVALTANPVALGLAA